MRLCIYFEEPQVYNDMFIINAWYGGCNKVVWSFTNNTSSSTVNSITNETVTVFNVIKYVWYEHIILRGSDDRPCMVTTHPEYSITWITLKITRMLVTLNH